MRRWLFIAFYLLIWARAADPEPEIPPIRVSTIDTRLSKLAQARPPLIEAVDADAYVQCLRTRATNPRATCPPYRWDIPYSSLEATREVARDLRREWQRFEERYYWRVITELNNPAFYIPFCWLGLRGGDLNPPLPAPKISTGVSAINQGFGDRHPERVLGTRAPAAAGTHSLDIYYPLPQVENGTFCDDLALQILPIMYIPGFCIDIPQAGFSWCTPGYDQGEPLWFNSDEAERRVRDAINHAIGHYYKDYLAKTAEIASRPRLPATIDPTRWNVYAPFPWTTNLLSGGAVIAPVAPGLKPPQEMAREIALQVQNIHDVVERARPLVPAAEQGLLEAYFAQSTAGLVKMSGLGALASTLGGGLAESTLARAREAIAALDTASDLRGAPDYLADQTKTGAPGVYPWEEIKRWFPDVGALPVQERYGFVSMFEVFNRLDATILPTPKDTMGVLGLVQRVIVYWWVPVRLTITFTPTPPWVEVSASPDVPKPKAVPPYVLPFAGERVYYAWENVPEGYAIPRVKNRPLLPPGVDYARLLR